MLMMKHQQASIVVLISIAHATQEVVAIVSAKTYDQPGGPHNH